MKENKKNLNLIIIGTLLFSTIIMTSVSGVFISKYNQEKNRYNDTYHDYLDTLNKYNQTLEDLHLAEIELQKIQDNIDFSGIFYGLSQVDLNYYSSTVNLWYTIPYSNYFYYRLTLEHPSHSSSSLTVVAQKIASYCKADSVAFLAEYIAQIVSNPSDDECVIDGLLTFCQDRGDFESSIHYNDDGTDDFSKYPIETLAEGGGDCEDHSILFASLARALDYNVRICVIPGHVFVAVQLDLSPTYTDGWHITNDNKNYYICETTGYGWLIGDCPVDYQDESIYSYPVL